MATWDDFKRQTDEKFLAGTVTLQLLRSQRGGLLGAAKNKLNAAIAFQNDIKKHGLKRESQTLQQIREHLYKCDLAQKKLRYLNNKIIGHPGFYPLAERSSDNQAWMDTYNYCKEVEDSFLVTRYNLYHYLFVLIEDGESEEIMRIANPANRHFQSIRIPNGEMIEDVLTDAVALRQHNIPPPGELLPVEDVLDMSGVGNNDTVIGGEGGGDAAGGHDEQDREDTPAPGLGVENLQTVDGGTRSKTTQGLRTGTGFPTLTTDTGRAPPSAAAFFTSTLKNPLQFGDLRKQTNEIKMPTSFQGLGLGTMGTAQKPNTVPLNRFEQEHPWQGRDPWTDPVNSQQNRGFGAIGEHLPAQNTGTNNEVLRLLSMSLSSNFNARNIITEKWDGNPQKFEQFMLQWMKVDNQMTNLNLSGAFKYAELCRCTSGLAAQYISGLPPSSDHSYNYAMGVLYAVYSQRKQTMKDIIQNFCQMKPCNSDYQSRMKFHASLLSYKVGLNSLSAQPQDVLFGFELGMAERLMDKELRRSWLKYVEKQRDLDAPLGYRISFESLITQVHRIILEGYKTEQDYSWGMRDKSWGNKSDKRVVAAAASAGSGAPDRQRAAEGSSRTSRPTEGRSRQTTPKPNETAAAAGAGGQKGCIWEGVDRNSPKCPWCEINGKKQHRHKFPLGCPKIRNQRLTSEQIREKVIKDNLCRNCFGPHRVAICDAPEYVHCKIDNCTARHHSSFHNANRDRNVTIANPEVRQRSESRPRSEGRYRSESRPRSEGRYRSESRQRSESRPRTSAPAQ